MTEDKRSLKEKEKELGTVDYYESDTRAFLYEDVEQAVNKFAKLMINYKLTREELMLKYSEIFGFDDGQENQNTIINRDGGEVSGVSTSLPDTHSQEKIISKDFILKATPDTHGQSERARSCEAETVSNETSVHASESISNKRDIGNSDTPRGCGKYIMKVNGKNMHCGEEVFGKIRYCNSCKDKQTGDKEDGQAM